MRALRWLGRSEHLAPHQLGRETVLRCLKTGLDTNNRLRHTAAAVVIELDNGRQIEDALEYTAYQALLIAICEKITPILRKRDVMVQLDATRFAIALSPHRKLDLESAIQFSTRIQHRLVDPLMIDDTAQTVSVSIGFCLAGRMERPTPERLLHAASTAQGEASRSGPNAIRSFSPAMQGRISARNELVDQLDTAFAEGQISAFFQPQLALHTSEITGFEALARWRHPQRGMISPAEFLPVLERAGQMGRLGRKMLCDSMQALARWDQMGWDIPQVSVNLSNVELRNPALVDYVLLELDKHALEPNRLVIEVLETVVATNKDDLIVRNLDRLAEIGCRIDLDDFGTGHASITTIRQFAINRIKIDRSFITRIDQDSEQRAMVDAILTMAERLGLHTLAEGVETKAEQDTLTEMGCEHLQGFVLARPMSFHQVCDWLEGQRRPQTHDNRTNNLRAAL